MRDEVLRSRAGKGTKNAGGAMRILLSGFLLVFVFACTMPGCVSRDVSDVRRMVLQYQTRLQEQGPQERLADEGLGLLRPAPNPRIPELPVADDGDDTKRVYLSLEDAVLRTIANSPEISVVSYDPAIAREEITRAVAEFDPKVFGTLNYENQNSPVDSFTKGGESDVRLWESGFKQKGITGVEWSLSYGLSRDWDDLTTRMLHHRYKPMLVFQVRQPLLRDGWFGVNLAGVDITKRQYKLAMEHFREEVERSAATVISTYWNLYQLRHDLTIQEELVQQGVETLEKVRNRKDIDATTLQLKQAEASVEMRNATLLRIKKQLRDAQDALLQLLADHQLNLVDDLEIVPKSPPEMKLRRFDVSDLLERALENNPQIKQAELRAEIAEIERDTARWQRLPKLDLVASSRLEGMAKHVTEAHNRFDDGDYASFSVGLLFEYPLGNRQANAMLRRKEHEYSQARSAVRVAMDTKAAETKEAVRLAMRSYEEIELQEKAVAASEVHLQAIEDTEKIRQKLTPEFLLVKLQAQESLATAKRSLARAIASYNIAFVSVAQATGAVLELGYVKESVTEGEDKTGDNDSGVKLP